MVIGPAANGPQEVDDFCSTIIRQMPGERVVDRLNGRPRIFGRAWAWGGAPPPMAGSRAADFEPSATSFDYPKPQRGWGAYTAIR